METLTISIPAYNEGNSIKTLIDECINIGNKLKLNYQILIINDGSTNETAKYIDELIQKHQQTDIKLHTHQTNKGFGTTIREVFQIPNSEWIFFISGDNQFPASNLETMIQHAQDYDFILGYRTTRNDSIYRKLNSKIYNLLISAIGGIKIQDVNSIALVKSSVIKNIDIQSKSAFIHTEIFLKALKKNAKIIEVPIKHNERTYGEASGGKLKTIFFAIFEMIKYSLGKL